MTDITIFDLIDEIDGEFRQARTRVDKGVSPPSAAVVRFVLSDTYGNPPVQGAGVLIGAEADDIADLKALLKCKYGTRLISCH